MLRHISPPGDGDGVGDHLDDDLGEDLGEHLGEHLGDGVGDHHGEDDSADNRCGPWLKEAHSHRSNQKADSVCLCVVKIRMPKS